MPAWEAKQSAVTLKLQFGMEYRSTDVVNYWTVFCFGEAERLMSLTDIKQVTFCIWVFWGCAAVGQCCVELSSRTILEMNFDPLSRATLQPTKELIANNPIVQFYTTPTRPQHLWSPPPSHLFSFWRSRVTKFSKIQTLSAVTKLTWK